MDHSVVDKGQQTFTFMVSLAALIGIFTSYFLYRAAHRKKETNVGALDTQKDSVGTSEEETRELLREAREAYNVVDDQKKQTEAVVRGIAEGVVVVNQKGEVLLMNPSAEKLLGIRKEKKIGRSILDDMGDELMVSLARDVGDGEKVIEYRTKDENVKKVIRASSAVIQDESGQTVGMLNVLTDVTKQRELEDIKNSFVSNITHEFRTPIVAMQKAAALVLNQSAGPLNETQTSFLNIVSRNLGHLSRLVEDLLDAAKIESGKMRIKLTRSRLDKVIADCCETLDTWATSKGVQIVHVVEGDIPEFHFDPDKITQVLNNLIGNAIKFTPPGGKITVKAAWSQEGKEVRVSVSDNGAGISKEDMPKLFRRFEQFGDQRGIGGTGLGLSISKEIVERHGGQITVESAEKEGSSFTFTLLTKPHIIGG